MSSILRALKKLEKNPQRKATFKPWQRKADAQKISGRSIRRTFLGNGIFYFLLTVSFLVVGGWLMLEYAPDLMKTLFPSALITNSKENNKTVAPTALKTPVNPLVKPQPAASSRIRKTKPKTRKTTTVSRRGISVSERRVRNIPPEFNTSRVRTRPKKRRPRAAAQSASTTSRKRPPLARKDQSLTSPDKIRSPAEADNPIIVKSKGESGFEVQAIAWSHTPEKRIAVINSQVVHEGDSVDGAYVSKIDIEDVSLKFGNKTLRIKCGR